MQNTENSSVLSDCFKLSCFEFLVFLFFFLPFAGKEQQRATAPQIRPLANWRAVLLSQLGICIINKLCKFTRFMLKMGNEVS